MAPRHLDFNGNSNGSSSNAAAVFQLVRPEIINHNESCQTQKPLKTDMIKVEDTIGYSQEATTNRANRSYDKSTAHLSNTHNQQQ